MRTGLIGKKIGMSRILTEKGEHIPVTLIHIDSCEVVSLKTKEKNGYTAIQVGYGEKKPQRVSKPLKGFFQKVGLKPKQKLVEFRVTEDALLKVGDKISPTHFVPGQKVDVTGITTGKGFAGAMKRWNFGGLRASHGVSITHRSHGSTGNRQDPGRVFKGKKMAGHLGVERVTTQNLSVVSIDEDRNLLLIKGAVPGVDGAYVIIRDAIKVKAEGLPFPAALRSSKESSSASEQRVTQDAQEVPQQEASAPTESQESKES